jgi:hypothetical protein
MHHHHPLDLPKCRLSTQGSAASREGVSQINGWRAVLFGQVQTIEVWRVACLWVAPAGNGFNSTRLPVATAGARCHCRFHHAKCHLATQHISHHSPPPSPQSNLEVHPGFSFLVTPSANNDDEMAQAYLVDQRLGECFSAHSLFPDDLHPNIGSAFTFVPFGASNFGICRSKGRRLSVFLWFPIRSPTH